MSAESPRRSSGSGSRCAMAMPAIVPPQVVSDRSIFDSAIGFINEVTLAHQPPLDPKDTITWARFETTADISDPRFGEDWELEGNVAPPLLLILGYGLGVQVWAIPANGEAVEVLSWRHGIVSALRILPSPLPTVTDEENGRTHEPNDGFVEKRPLMALVDGSPSSGSQPQFCAVTFVSLKTGAQVKTIKFKNPVVEILANRCSVVITFHERIAVFDAYTLEDRLSITTCYPSPGINPNPATLGPRWLAYAENKLLHSKRSGGGCDGDGVVSYTATVLNASKSLVKGLRELGEQVAAGLTGASGSGGISKNTPFDSGCGLDTKQTGVVTIIDIKNPLKAHGSSAGVPTTSNQIAGADSIVAHFIAHPEAVVAMEFDNSGLLLVTADRRGHDFHVFRIQPNPVGSSLAAVHHLYILHRGDTTAKVQNITLTLDSRWVAVSTLRGTTHVFPITPYGGPMGVRTHTSLHVVNKLSRFHRSAGLSGEGRSNSPISHSESTTFNQSLQPYHNSTLPPFPRPTVVMPLAQLRQPFTLGSPPGSASVSGAGGSRAGTQRQRLSSLSDDNGKPLSVCAIFAKSRSWLLDPPNVTREASHRVQRKAVDSLFIMAGHGALIQYDLGTRLASNVAKDKICDDTPIELEIEAKAQWNLGRRKECSQEIMPPLSPGNWLMRNRNSCILNDSTRQYDDSDERSESWLSQVEIITHAGPHRRLWMGPQFVFKTYNTPSGSNLNHVDIEAVEIGTTKPTSASTSEKLGHSSPLNMPFNASGRSSAVPVLIESGSYSSIEQSPKLMDRFRHDHLDSDYSVAHGDSRLKEDLADAMRESPSAGASSKDAGGHVCVSGGSSDNVAFYDALTTEDDDPVYIKIRSASAAALASVLPNIHSYDNCSSYESLESAKKEGPSIEKVVNPLGTVTTVTTCLTADVKRDILDEVVSQLAAEDTIIHENCDESLFRPVVAIFCDEKTLLQNQEEARKNNVQSQPSEIISSKLVVPVIAKEVNDELSRREKEKNTASKSKAVVTKTAKEELKVVEGITLNKKLKEGKKAGKLIDSVCADVRTEENSFQKNEASTSNHGNRDNPQFEKKTKRGCSKNKDSKEMSIEIEKVGPKKDKSNKISKEIHERTEDIAGTQPEIELKKQTKKEAQDHLSENKDKNLIVKNNDTKVKIMEIPNKTEPLFKSQQENKESVSETKKTSCAKVEDSSSNASRASKANQEEVTKFEMSRGTVENKSESNFITTHHNLTEASTALKEKVKKDDSSVKARKLNHQDIIANIQSKQLPDDEGKMQKSEEKSEANKTRETKSTSMTTETENIVPTTSSSASEKKDKIRMVVNNESHSVEERDESKTLENPTNVMGQKGTSRKKEGLKGKSNELKQSETINFVANMEQKIADNYGSVNKGSDNAENDKLILNEETFVSKSSNSLNECKNKSVKMKPAETSKSADCTEENGDKNKQLVKIADNDKTKRTINSSKKEKILQNESKSEKLRMEREINVRENKPETEEKDKSSIKDEENKCQLVISNANCKDLSKKESSQTKTKQDRSNEGKSFSLTQGEENTSKDINKKEKCDLKRYSNVTLSENKNNKPTSNQSSLKRKEKETTKHEIKKGQDISETKISDSFMLEKENPEKEVAEDDKAKDKTEKNEEELMENASSVCSKPYRAVKKTPSQILAPSSVWKGTDFISKNLKKTNNESSKFSSVGATSEVKNSEKLLPELPTPIYIEKQTNLDPLSVLKSLEPLPPLPALEPLELTPGNKASSSKDDSLITFESPLLETSSIQRKITPAPRGFTEQNLILALCGSLHYENEHSEGTELSPTFSSNNSSVAFEDTSVADFKSLTENDDPYMSLEQSSQNTNTTTANTTNEKFSSSTNSSGSEEVIIIEEKKMTKKQKRKKQQHLKELQKQKEQNHNYEMDDEELRPLISITDSQINQNINSSKEDFLEIAPKYEENESLSSQPPQPIMHSTTTDSEGPLPATTSDENVFSIPVPIVHNPHKIKTKKLEHKINLIAAIEAATSSSTSSAEESGVDLAGRSSHDNVDLLISVANNISNSTLPIPIVATPQTVGALKKKTKRRKR